MIDSPYPFRNAVEAIAQGMNDVRSGGPKTAMAKLAVKWESDDRAFKGSDRGVERARVAQLLAVRLNPLHYAVLKATYGPQTMTSVSVRGNLPRADWEAAILVISEAVVAQAESRCTNLAIVRALVRRHFQRGRVTNADLSRATGYSVSAFEKASSVVYRYMRGRKGRGVVEGIENAAYQAAVEVLRSAGCIPP